MKVLVNNEEIPSVRTPDEANRGIRAFLQERNLFITSIRANESPVDLELEMAVRLEGLEKLEISAATAEELMKDSIADATEYIPNLTEGLQRAADYFQQGQENEATKIFIQATEGLDWIVQLVAMLEQNPAVLGGQAPEMKLEGISAETREKMSLLLEAWENRDYILIGDLLSYEVIPLLENILGLLKEIGAE